MPMLVMATVVVVVFSKHGFEVQEDQGPLKKTLWLKALERKALLAQGPLWAQSLLAPKPLALGPQPPEIMRSKSVSASIMRSKAVSASGSQGSVGVEDPAGEVLE